MISKLVITDLTRMQGGRVCIAGYDTEDHRCIRPTLPPPGIPENILYKSNKVVVHPFAEIELELLKPDSQPPHTEDYRFNPYSIHYLNTIRDRQAVLEWSLFDSVTSLFEQPIYTDVGYSVMDCQGPRSLGTIRPQTIISVIYEPSYEGAWDYRLHFVDESGEAYRLKITDLTWQYYCQSLRGPTAEPKIIADELTNRLRNSKVYLRIGLARGWKKFPDRCFLQITGVYNFPDYLDGRIFADFITNKPQLRK